MKRIFILALIAVLTGLVVAEDAIDWNKAQELHKRATRGEKLSPEDQAYYQKAQAARGQGATAKSKGKSKGDGKRAEGGKPTVGLVPLTDMTAAQNYKGEDGGLYGHGSNMPPEAHLKMALGEAAKIQPLNAAGHPAKDGKIVLLVHGMSNTTMQAQAFIKLAATESQKNPDVVIVDGAQGGIDSRKWVKGEGHGQNPWDVMLQRIQSAGVTPQQVQAIWMKHAIISPATIGEFPKHAQVLKEDTEIIIKKLKELCPNLRLVYVASRTYAGWATSQLNPEPYSYESAFAMRWVIQDQIKGEAGMSAAGGKMPVVLWGPYIWTDGEKGRKIDSLVWKQDDTVPSDGTHPSNSGREKVAQLLMDFFKSDATAKNWFCKH